MHFLAWRHWRSALRRRRRPTFRSDRRSRLDDSLWLGHFSGGRNLAPGAEPIPLDWVDVKQNFASLRDCSAWLKDMTQTYSTYEGWKTCVQIR